MEPAALRLELIVLQKGSADTAGAAGAAGPHAEGHERSGGRAASSAECAADREGLRSAGNSRHCFLECKCHPGKRALMSFFSFLRTQNDVFKKQLFPA